MSTTKKKRDRALPATARAREIDLPRSTHTRFRVARVRRAEGEFIIVAIVNDLQSPGAFRASRPVIEFHPQAALLVAEALNALADREHEAMATQNANNASDEGEPWWTQ